MKETLKSIRYKQDIFFALLFFGLAILVSNDAVRFGTNVILGWMFFISREIKITIEDKRDLNIFLSIEKTGEEKDA